jgi:hypothetical protein
VTGQPSRIQLAADATTNTAGQPICRSTLTNPGNGCVPVNLFGVNNWSAAARDYLYADGWLKQEFTQKALAANLQGDLFSTWAGPVPLAVGVEYRDNASSTTADPISASSGFYVFNSSVVSGGIEVTEGYAETVVPLAADLPFAKSLSVMHSAMYSTSGDGRPGSIWCTFSQSARLLADAARPPRTVQSQVSGFQTSMASWCRRSSEIRPAAR